MPGTGYPDLDELLEDFAASARSILGEGLVAVYLQGSFALGDADEHSDVDWIAVTEADPTAEELAALQSMHQRLYRRTTPWAQHLEGSYLARALIRRIDPERRPVWIDPANERPREVGAFEMLRPRGGSAVEPLVHRLQGGELFGGRIRLGNGDPVDVAVLVRVSERERAL